MTCYAGSAARRRLVAKIQPKSRDMGAELSLKDRTELETYPRMLRDHMLVEPVDEIYSAIIYVPQGGKPMKGIVRAVGPGHYPKQYDHPDKKKRKKMWDGKTFQPTECKVGDKVELGGSQYGGYSFQTLYVAGKLHLICREADVAGIYTEDDA